MALIRVTASEIRKTAEQLRTYNQNFDGQVKNLESSEGSLNTMWDGQANDAFHTAFMNDKQYMDQFYQLINKYCQALDEIAVQYENAETVNTDTASRRNF